MSEAQVAPTRPPFFTRDKNELAALVAAVDPELKFVRDLHPQATTSRTLLVKQNGVKRTLKVRRVSQNMWDDTYFHLEIFALQRAAERNLTCVTHMIKHYENDEYEAILKTFAEGTPLTQLNVDELLHSRAFIKKLDELYRKLHLAWIAKIKFLPRKVVIGREGDLILVDLSTCVVNTEYGIGRFVYEMRADSQFITRLERNATH